MKYSLDKFLKKVAALPVVQQMVQEETLQANAEILKARIDCIKLMKSLEVKATEAEAIKDSAWAEFKAAEEKVKPYLSRAIAADRACTEAQQACMAPYKLLHSIYGESHVFRALGILHGMRLDCKREIEILTGALNPHLMVEGRVTFRPVPPAVKQNLEVQKRRLEGLERLYSGANGLINAEISPRELQQHTETLLNAGGYASNLVEFSNEEAAL